MTLRTPQQIAISQGMKAHWKQRKAGNWTSPSQSEAQLHRSVAAYLRLALLPPTLWTSMDAGAGKMSRFAAGDRKARGVQKGWPDILIVQPRAREGYSFVLGIELKTAKGRSKPEQTTMVERFKAAGALLVVCRSIEDVDHALYINGIPRHASLGSMPSPSREGR